MDQVQLRLAAIQALTALGFVMESDVTGTQAVIDDFARYLTSTLDLGPKLSVASAVAPFPGGAA